MPQQWKFKDVRGGIEATTWITCSHPGCGKPVSVTELIPDRGSVSKVTMALARALDVHKRRH